MTTLVDGLKSAAKPLFFLLLPPLMARVQLAWQHPERLDGHFSSTYPNRLYPLSPDRRFIHFQYGTAFLALISALASVALQNKPQAIGCGLVSAALFVKSVKDAWNYTELLLHTQRLNAMQKQLDDKSFAPIKSMTTSPGFDLGGSLTG